MRNVKGFLIDLDGVLYIGDNAIPGAQETIEFLKNRGYLFRFVSNTTRKSRDSIAKRLLALGFNIPTEYIFTPARAAVSYMKQTGLHHCDLLITGDVHKDFEQMRISGLNTKIDCIIIGDAGDMITYDTLNAAFRKIMEGADIIALEKDRYWMAPDGLYLSAGPIVSAIEYATGKKAMVVGKPSVNFFKLALRDMDILPSEAVMIGDDIATDIGGAQAAGMQGILVKTGKFREDCMKEAGIIPTRIIDSIAHLPKILEVPH
jgi:HAD superfamily hydrolase (TIGR01458 family)